MCWPLNFPLSPPVPCCCSYVGRELVADCKDGDFLVIELAHTAHPWMIGQVVKDGEGGRVLDEDDGHYESYMGSMKPGDFVVDVHLWKVSTSSPLCHSVFCILGAIGGELVPRTPSYGTHLLAFRQLNVDYIDY